jgi:rare lipoprotein A
MQREARFYGALVIIAVTFTMAMLAALPAQAACGALASWYGFESGNRTANGERYDPWGMTAAHRTLPFGTVVRVTLGSRSVTVRISDRGPAAWTGREIDLSLGAATVLGMVERGVVPVCITVLP